MQWFPFFDQLFTMTNNLILTGAVGQGSSIPTENNFNGKENTEVSDEMYSTSAVA